MNWKNNKFKYSSKRFAKAERFYYVRAVSAGDIYVARKRLAEQRKAYKEYSAEHGLKPHNDRTSVVKMAKGGDTFGEVYKDYGKEIGVDKAGESGIIKTSSNKKSIKLKVNFFDKSDPIYFDALSIEEESGFEDICIHGSPDSVQRVVDGKPVNMNAKEFAQFLKNETSYKGGNIRLASCSAGKGDNSFAQQLSKELGVTVKAPDNDVYYIPDDGVLFVGSPYSNTGNWRIFRNGEEIK